MTGGVTVVVMAFNEVGGLAPFVRELYQTLSGMGLPYEVLIVDDGSSDGTGAAAEELAAALSDLRVLHHDGNQGLGAVYRTGFREARGELLTFFPADGQFSPDILPRFVALVPDHDLVLGYLPGGRTGLSGRALSAVERALYFLLFGSLPRFQGVFLVRCAALRKLTLVSDGRGWAVVMEMLVRARRAGLRIRSEPTSLRPRHSGVSKVQNLRTVWSNFRQLLALRLRL
jgi:dolichol-phosphate mannosyltransferase